MNTTLEFINLKEIILEKCTGRRVYYCANPGNWGDALIRYGTLKFFNDIGLEYKELPLSKWRWLRPAISGGIAIYGGGGSFTPNYTFGAHHVNRLSSRFEVIVLPSTYAINVSAPNALKFRRDQRESKENQPDSIFCHDMALYIGRLETKTGRGTGNFFRTDLEKTEIPLPANNRDLSAEASALAPVHQFLHAISQFKEVNTNRLHVAIAATLMGKKVNLYANSYFKNKAIYEATLRPYFDNVRFCESN